MDEQRQQAAAIISQAREIVHERWNPNGWAAAKVDHDEYGEVVVEADEGLELFNFEDNHDGAQLCLMSAAFVAARNILPSMLGSSDYGDCEVPIDTSNPVWQLAEDALREAITELHPEWVKEQEQKRATEWEHFNLTKAKNIAKGLALIYENEDFIYGDDKEAFTKNWPLFLFNDAKGRTKEEVEEAMARAEEIVSQYEKGAEIHKEIEKLVSEVEDLLKDIAHRDGGSTPEERALIEENRIKTLKLKAQLR